MKLLISLVFLLGCIFALSSAAKRGIAWSSSNPIADASLFTSAQIDWYYTWSPTKQSGMPSRLEFVPMLWNSGGGSSFENTVLSYGSKEVLGFNEPDNSGQADMTPSVAATAWKSFIQPLSSHGIRLGAPAVTNGAGGLPWLREFIGNCSGCTIDFIPIHWYATIPPTNEYFRDYVTSFHTTFNKPIWITEFADTDTTIANDVSFINYQIPWLDSQSFIERYAYFGPFRGSTWENLVATNGGALTSIGTAYNAS